MLRSCVSPCPAMPLQQPSLTSPRFPAEPPHHQSHLPCSTHSSGPPPPFPPLHTLSTDKERAAQVQGPPKAIKHRNTRFPGPQALSSCGDTTPASSATGTQPGSPGSLHGAAFVGVDGLSYPVLATPSFDPGEATPFMTWGDIQATPLRIEAEDLPAGDLNAGTGHGLLMSKREQVYVFRAMNADRMAAGSRCCVERRSSLHPALPCCHPRHRAVWPATRGM